MRRGDGFVELPDCFYRLEFRQIVFAWIQPILQPHPFFQITDEIPFVDPVLRPFERARALLDLDDRRHRRDAEQLARRMRTELASEFKRQIPTQRVSRYRNRW